MISIAFAILLVIGALVVSKKITNYRWIGGVLAAIAVCVMVSASFYRLDGGEAAVLKSVTNKVVGSEYTTSGGIHPNTPWVNAVKFNVRNQQISFLTGYSDDKDDNKADDKEITSSTSDNATTYIDVVINYSLDPSKIELIYTNQRSEDNLRAQLIRITRSVLQIAPTTFSALEIRPRRPELQVKYKADIESRIAATKPLEGVLIDSVDVRDVRFTPDVQKDLDGVQQRNAKTEQARADLETVRIEAEKTKTIAKAESDADQIARCGATIGEETQTIGGKPVRVKVVNPVPANLCQNRLNEQVLMAKYIAMLGLAAEKGNTIFVIPPGTNNLLQLSKGAATAGGQPPAEK